MASVEHKFAYRKLITVWNLTAEDLRGFDVVIDAFGTWTPETFQQHGSSLQKLCDILAGTDTRLLIVGGAGCLYVNDDTGHKVMLIDVPDFPDAFKPLAQAEVDAFLALQKREDILWTYVYPPLLIRSAVAKIH